MAVKDPFLFQFWLDELKRARHIPQEPLDNLMWIESRWSKGIEPTMAEEKLVEEYYSDYTT